DYFGVFKQKKQKDVHWPLTKTQVDSIAANLDYDSGDIRVVAKQNKYRDHAALLSELLKIKLKKSRFGRFLNEAISQMVRDGVVVTRTDKSKPFTHLVDLENFWTDFNSDKPTWFLERVPLHKSMIPDSWNMTLIAEERTSRFRDVGDKIRNDEVVAYRYEGLMPRGWINNTGDKEQIYGLLWITGMEFGEPYIQSRKILGKDMSASTYDYAQFVPNQNRFISVGIPEALRDLQKYINAVINNRVDRARLASTGLIQVRKNSGITSQDLQNLVTGGAITVSEIGRDIAQTPFQDVSPVSFNEQLSIESASNLLTGSTEISRGQRNRQVTLGQTQIETAFSNQRLDIHRESMGFMIESILDKWLDIVISKMKEDESITVTDESFLKELASKQGKVDQIKMASNVLKQFGPEASQQLLGNKQVEQQIVEKRLKQNEWKLVKEELKNIELKTEVSINSESQNLSVIANNIVQTLPIVAQVPGGAELIEPLTQKLMELLGIGQSFDFRS
ncbi:MAG: hypothetical protein WD512_17305, partial [Candidatus Paceibacterota bacterium]